MSSKLNYKDIEVDILYKDELKRKVEDYLANESVNVVELVSMDYLSEYCEDNHTLEKLSETDLVLPGDREVLLTLSQDDVEKLENDNVVVDYKAAGAVLKDGLFDGKKLYLSCRNRKEAFFMQRYLKAHYPLMEIVKIQSEESGRAEEAIINEINTLLPDVVIVSMSEYGSDDWVFKNKAMLNTKLCICIGSVMDVIFYENVHIPKFFKFIHMEKFYSYMLKRPYKRSVRRRDRTKKSGLNNV
ncbi:WecB/TagA/CpsF family glycosyltransferase [Eubacterium xylanophilum]|uniref:WecB/TagA/CpsF family glycosyltransferase n=1 Tax=Eubacterium xylanophilum TaxID=39497 RepID=UPI00047DB008|nr:WecB/TagA/CpsF family glycosyltransferase [Eubacterium xylanophilum]